MARWTEAEQKITDKVNCFLPADYKAIPTGKSNSKHSDTHIVKDGNVSCGYIETKIIPSVAGVQAVVKYDDNQPNLLVPNSTKNVSSHTAALVDLANSQVFIPGKVYQLYGVPADEAFKIFVDKYKEMKVLLFAGIISDKKLVAFNPSIENFQKHFSPSIILRPKRSGSRDVPTRDRQALVNYFREFSTVTEGKKFRFMDLEEVPFANEFINIQQPFPDKSIWVNSEGVVKVLGKTNNLNILLSLGLSPMIKEERFLTDEQFGQLVIKTFVL